MASVQDPNTGLCSQMLVGLVGIHIVQKTPTRPQWIWSSFEQVDNVPPALSGGPGPYAFNDGTSTAQPKKNPNQLLPGQTPPVTEPLSSSMSSDSHR